VGRRSSGIVDRQASVPNRLVLKSGHLTMTIRIVVLPISIQYRSSQRARGERALCVRECCSLAGRNPVQTLQLEAGVQLPAILRSVLLSASARRSRARFAGRSIMSFGRGLQRRVSD
jgi:hypothetical protein